MFNAEPPPPSAAAPRPLKGDEPPDNNDYGTLFDALPIGAYRSRPDGVMLRANPALARLNGYASTDALCLAVHDLERGWYIDPDRRAQFRSRLERDGLLSGFVSEVRRYANGERIWISENAHVVRRADGSVAYYEGTVEDISERVHAQSALARNERYLREIAEHIPGMAYRVQFPADSTHAPHYTFVSTGVYSLYGVSAEALMADPQVLRQFRHPDDAERVDVEVAAAVAEQRNLTVAFRILVRGRIKWVQMSSSAVISDGGDQLRVGVMLDVTSQRQSEAFRRERDRAESAQRHMIQFLSRVSHELRTPLNAINGFAQLIEMEPGTPDRQRRWAHTLLSSGRHLLDMVNDVLDLTGAQSGMVAVTPGDVDVHAVLHEAWGMVQADAQARQLRYAGPHPASAGLQVRADRRRLLQVLTNLLSNAVKYNRPGGPLTVDLQRDDGQVLIAVTDGGAGMSAEQLLRLFSPFDRLGAQHSTVPGTGLGLALSRQLAEAMGGSLHASSPPGGGCTFTLSLPMVEGGMPPGDTTVSSTDRGRP